MNYKDKTDRSSLKEALMKLNRQQLKLFYGMLVHYWAEYRFFISKQNFKRLLLGLAPSSILTLVSQWPCPALAMTVGTDGSI